MEAASARRLCLLGTTRAAQSPCCANLELLGFPGISWNLFEFYEAFHEDSARKLRS